jgi:hypothetical protein
MNLDDQIASAEKRIEKLWDQLPRKDMMRMLYLNRKILEITKGVYQEVKKSKVKTPARARRVLR